MGLNYIIDNEILILVPNYFYLLQFIGTPCILCPKLGVYLSILGECANLTISSINLIVWICSNC